MNDFKPWLFSIYLAFYTIMFSTSIFHATVNNVLTTLGTVISIVALVISVAIQFHYILKSEGKK